MKKRVILLFIFILILTGCSVEYNLTIEETGYGEEVTLKSENESDKSVISLYNDPIATFIDAPIASETKEKIDGVEYYNIEKTTENGHYILRIENNFKQTEYIKSTIVNNSSSIFKIYKVGNIYQLFAGPYFKCFEMNNGINNLTIKIKLSDDYEMVESDADNKNNNVYIWNINTSNYKNKSIHFYYQKKEIANENSNDDNDNNTNIQLENNSKDYTLYIFCGIILIVLLLGYFIFKKIINKNNDVMDD